jgi:fatty acid desaturase
MPAMGLHARNQRMLAETVGLFVGLFGLGLWAEAEGWLPLMVAAGVLQGLWFQRLYVVGHESAHRSLSSQVRVNDVLGQVALLPLLVPINVFRAIHRFHHGANRRDARSAALDVFVVPDGAGPLRRGLPWLIWYGAVFAGGWFVHGLVSVVLFLFMPPTVARRISPAFNRWTGADQGRAVGAMLLGLGLHLGVLGGLGASAWWAVLGVPFVVFAWVYSVQLYVYHYRTTMGSQVLFHARSVRASRLTRWWLLNLPLHASHHRWPKVPWHALRADQVTMPEGFEHNQRGVSWIGAVWAQWAGPTVVSSAEALPERLGR